MTTQVDDKSNISVPLDVSGVEMSQERRCGLVKSRGFSNLAASANMDDLSKEELYMEIELGRLRVEEALCARDAVVERLSEACASVRQKASLIASLKVEREDIQRHLESPGGMKEAISPDDILKTSEERKRIVAELWSLADVIKNAQDDVMLLKGSEDSKGKGAVNYFSTEVENNFKPNTHDWEASINKIIRLISDPTTLGVFKDVSNDTIVTTSPATIATPKDIDAQDSPRTSYEAEMDSKGLSTPLDPSENIRARNAILAALPIPNDIPSDSLIPIVIPAPFTLHDFLGTTAGYLRTQLGNYRVFQQSTTAWCPEREEHGYFLTPIFKCNTNPRVTTAHRWTVVDIAMKLDRPTECFYNKDGKWYYAGVYKTFRLEDLSVQEWENLSNEASQTLIKDTLAGRKNTSPQNIYETGQLYLVGALRVACIGLQCIGFNNGLYRGILEHAALCAQTGKWRGAMASPGLTWSAANNLAGAGGSGISFNTTRAAPSTGGDNSEDHDADWKTCVKAP